MPTPHIFTDTTPVFDGEDPTVARCTITDAWGLVFAQGGVVMAAALRAMEAVVDRPDLSLTSASATFCRPVACGPVTTSVQVLRRGRRGAQALGLLCDVSATPEEPSVVATAVFTDPGLEGPELRPLPRPPELTDPPEPGTAPRIGDDERPGTLGFLDNTEWHVATTDVPVESALPRLPVWFRFTNPPAEPGEPWEPALLAIPGDALGTSLVAALGEGDRPVGSVSLQMDMQVFAPISGEWIGVDSVCTNVGRGLASGTVDLWSESGVHVASLTQTAMLRSF
jgi:acyl-CoA thioesterase